MDYLSSGKGVNPYEKIKDYDCLNIERSPENGFYKKNEFYSELKTTIITDQEYEDVKKLFCVIKMRNLSDINELYNFQNTMILCEIFESRAQLIHEKYGFNPRRCNSTNTLSDRIQRTQSKVIIELPTDSETVELFKKTLIGVFSRAITHLAFDTNVNVKC